MKYLTYFLLIISLLIGFTNLAQAQKKSKKDILYTLTTPYGDMKFILYEKTPKHRENFQKLVKEKFYDGLLFHRVIQDFMIQGGDPESKNAEITKMLGSGNLGYTVDAEFDTAYIHKKGAIAAARTNNPEKASSSCQFYIVKGRKVNESQLEMLEQKGGFKYTEAQKELYQNLGGTPHLDQEYTVFGEVLQGLDIIDKVAEVKTQAGDRPKIDVPMNISYKKVKKKDITKEFGYQYAE